MNNSEAYLNRVRIAFFGHCRAFDYHHIGGTDSIIRRLAHQLVSIEDVSVDLITYGHEGSPTTREYHAHRLSSQKFTSLTNAFSVISDYDHVIVVYVLPKDRLFLSRFRRQTKHRIKYHMLWQSWPDLFTKRMLMFSDALLMPFNGISFAVSPRLVQFARHLGIDAKLLLPPVPNGYFVPLSGKITASRIRVTFLGRIDPGKGIIETLELFDTLSKEPEVELAVYGMHWPHDPESVGLHHHLLKQDRFRYEHVHFSKHSPTVDDMVRSVLFETDIFIQPYRKLSSTIDTPLLVLEAMASLAAVLTRPYGNIPQLYGRSRTLLDQHGFLEGATNLVLSAREWLPHERERISQQNEKLGFDTCTVTNSFLEILDS